MYGLFIDLLTAEYRSRHESPVPPAAAIVRLAWVPVYLRLLSPAPVAARVLPGLAGAGAIEEDRPCSEVK
jgi:hypothetical protein